MSWAHEICADDNEERAIVIASMNELAYVLQAWLPLIVWQQVDAPKYQKGFSTVTVLAFLMIVMALVIQVLQRREIAAKNRLTASTDGVVEYVEDSSSSGETVDKVVDTKTG